MEGKTIVARLALLAVAVSLIACSRGPEATAAAPAPAASAGVTSVSTARELPPAAAAPAPAAAAPAQTVLASQEYNDNPDLRCDVLEVRRVSGGALLIRWRLSRPAAPATAGLTAAPASKEIWHAYTWEGVYFSDPVEAKKYLGLRDSAGAWIGQGENKNYKPGDRQVIWMKFPAPPETSKRISFVFPGFPPFEDLPVAP